MSDLEQAIKEEQIFWRLRVGIDLAQLGLWLYWFHSFTGTKVEAAGHFVCGFMASMAALVLLITVFFGRPLSRRKI